MLITEAIHSKYVILIAFPLQQWLRERARIFTLNYIAYLVSLETRCNG